MRRSRRTLATIAIFLMVAASRSAIADGYIPPPCHGLPNIEVVACPSPYIELIPERRDEYMARNFLCRETGEIIGSGYEGGCGSWGMEGWRLPAGIPATLDYRAEIMEHVIDPCYLDTAKQVAPEGVDPEELMARAKARTTDTINDLVGTINDLLSTMGTFEERAGVYALGKHLCIEAVKSG